MLSEAVAFGGLQEVNLEGYMINEKVIKGKFDELLFKSTTEKVVLEVKLVFKIKDWFGVDEEDIYKNEFSTQMDRDGLAAMWILQHQRGYRPFINVIDYEKIVRIVYERNI